MNNEIQTMILEIRNHVNNPWKQNILLNDKKNWYMLCACMDCIENTQLAIDKFFSLPDFSIQGEGYLYLCGFLQACFLQQDAVSNLHMALYGQKIDWTKYKTIYWVRELRNDAIGHPTNRGNKSFHFIPRNSIYKDFFQIQSYRDTGYQVKDIIFEDVRKDQEVIVCEFLKDIRNKLQMDLIRHKQKFSDKTLSSLIQDYNYNIEKIYEGIDEDYPLSSLNFNELTNICENIKRGISERYGSVDVLPSIKLIFDSINYVLERLRNWISEGNLYKNNDAKIFLRAFKSYFNELQEMLAEIDREFAV